MLKTHLKSTALMAGIIVICALAASAILFYAAILNWSLTYAVLGLLISALVYLLYRFNEGRLEEALHAEAERRQQAVVPTLQHQPVRGRCRPGVGALPRGAELGALDPARVQRHDGLAVAAVHRAPQRLARQAAAALRA